MMMLNTKVYNRASSSQPYSQPRTQTHRRTQSRRKVTTDFHFPVFLDMSPYMLNEFCLDRVKHQ